jgi:hypothetical protein
MKLTYKIGCTKSGKIHQKPSDTPQSSIMDEFEDMNTDQVITTSRANQLRAEKKG